MKLSPAIFLSSLLIIACTSKPKAENSHSPEAYRQTIRGGLKEIKNCYEDLIKTEPKAEGKVVVEMSIDSKGKATKVETNKEKSTMTQPNFLNCINTKVASWNFPPSAPNETTEVNYPFYFRAGTEPINLDKFTSGEEAK